MVIALITWLMAKMGVAPSPEDFIRMNREFRERGHHLLIDFGGTRHGSIRWVDDDFYKQITAGLGYEYLVDRPYHGVGLEVLGQHIGRVLRSEDHRMFFIGAGLAYYPIRNLRLFTQGGGQIDMHGHTEAVGRFGLGYRIMFFKVGVQPNIYFQQTSSDSASWQLGARFEY
jgi:hypothetical protein